MDHLEPSDFRYRRDPISIDHLKSNECDPDGVVCQRPDLFINIWPHRGLSHIIELYILWTYLSGSNFRHLSFSRLRGGSVLKWEPYRTK